jgi:hypothetical protein
MTTDAIETQGTTLEISSGSGGAKNISGITLGAITKIASTSHGLSVGDVVAIASIVGTTGLNGLTKMIMAVETNAFYIDVDSSAMDAWVSGGTATPVAYTQVGEVADFDGPGGSASVIDATHLGSTAREKIMGIPDEGQFTFSLNRVFSDTGQAAVLAARAARAKKSFRVTYMDDTVQTFDGYVLQFSTSGGVDDKLNGSVTIEITGAVSTA